MTEQFEDIKERIRKMMEEAERIERKWDINNLTQEEYEKLNKSYPDYLQNFEDINRGLHKIYENLSIRDTQWGTCDFCLEDNRELYLIDSGAFWGCQECMESGGVLEDIHLEKKYN